MSMTPAANLPPVSLTPVADLPPVSTAQGELVAKFAAGVIDTVRLLEGVEVLGNKVADWAEPNKTF